jgi:hypothetical protein
MSETYVRSQILEIKQRVSSNEIKSANKLIKTHRETEHKFSLDDELLFWQIYTRKKVQCRFLLLISYLYITIVAYLILSGCNIWWKFIKENIRLSIAIWLLTPIALYYGYLLIKKVVLQPDNYRAKKILDAHFPDIKDMESDKTAKKE